MNQKKMVNAYSTLTTLGAAKLPIATVYKLFQLRKRLEPTYNFCLEQERIIIERYNGRLEGSTLYFADNESAQKAREEFAELNAMTVEYEYDPVEVCMADLDITILSMDDLAALEDFVSFV